MKNARDQGPPLEEPGDIDDDGDDAASEAEDTVEDDSPPAATATAAKTETEAEGTAADPLAELLKDERFVPRKDWEHATRKITEQGQELSARDTEIAKLHQELTALRRDLTGEEPTQTGQAQSTPAVGDTGLQQRIGLIEEALLEVYDSVKKRETLEKTSARLGTRPDITARITDLLTEGRTEDALDLAGQVAIKQYEQKQKAQTANTPPPKVMSGGGASRKQSEPEPLKPEDLPEDLEERKKFRFERLKKAFGLT